LLSREEMLVVKWCDIDGQITIDLREELPENIIKEFLDAAMRLKQAIKVDYGTSCIFVSAEKTELRDRLNKHFKGMLRGPAPAGNYLLEVPSWHVRVGEQWHDEIRGHRIDLIESSHEALLAEAIKEWFLRSGLRDKRHEASALTME